jgi:hypothetical protein
VKEALSGAVEPDVHGAVRNLTQARGHGGWELDDLSKQEGVTVDELVAQFGSKERLILDSLTTGSSSPLAEVLAGQPHAGRSARTRVLKTMEILSADLLASREMTKAMVSALACGQPEIKAALGGFNDGVRLAIARAIAGTEPGDPEWAAAEVLEQVWFAAVFAWASDLRGPEYIEASVRQALRVIGDLH